MKEGGVTVRGDIRIDAVVALSSVQVFPSELDSKFSFAFHCRYISTLLRNLQILDEDSRNSITFFSLTPQSGLISTVVSA